LLQTTIGSVQKDLVLYIHLYSPSNGSNIRTIRKQKIIKQG